VIVSDISRGERPDGGVRGLPEIPKAAPEPRSSPLDRPSALSRSSPPLSQHQLVPLGVGEHGTSSAGDGGGGHSGDAAGHHGGAACKEILVVGHLGWIRGRREEGEDLKHNGDGRFAGNVGPVQGVRGGPPEGGKCIPEGEREGLIGVRTRSLLDVPARGTLR
jgi:hypothetical protein